MIKHYEATLLFISCFYSLPVPERKVQLFNCKILRYTHLLVADFVYVSSSAGKRACNSLLKLFLFVQAKMMK